MTESIVVTKEEIQTYIQSIPPAPSTLQNVLLQLNAGELSKAASVANDDPALKLYLQNVVNKPIFGFQNDLKNLGQIFGVLGLAQAEQLIYNYMISLLSPKKWELFVLNEKNFCEIQNTLSIFWKKILEHKDINDKTIYSSISLLSASIAKEKTANPVMIRVIVKIRPASERGACSPKPTVVKVIPV